MKKIYYTFLLAAITFSNNILAQDVQWLTSTVVNYNLNPQMPKQPACGSANRIYAARMVDYSLNYGSDIFGSMSIDCYDPAGVLIWTYPIGPTMMVNAITSDAAGNVFVGGMYMETLQLGAADSLENTGSGFTINLFLIALDANGNLSWKRNVTLAHPDAQELSALGMDHQGACWYGLVYFDSTSIKKLDPNGIDMQSQSILGTRSMNSFSFDPMGNLYVTGSSGSIILVVNGFSVNVTEPYVMFATRIDASGNCSWIKLAHDVTFQSPHIVAAANGDAYLGGTLMDSASWGNIVFDGPQWVYDFFLTRVDSTGNFLWGVEVPEMQSITGDFDRGQNNFIDVDDAGNVYLAGMLRGIVDWGNGIITDAGPIPSNGMSVISFDMNGQPRWQISGASAGFVSPYSIVTSGVDECYFSTSVVGPITIDSVTTNQGGNDYAFVLGKIGSTTGISEAEGESVIHVFPNPVSNRLQVIQNSANGFSIYNILGERIYLKEKGASRNHDVIPIDTGNWSPGIYILESGKQREKFVVQ